MIESSVSPALTDECVGRRVLPQFGSITMYKVGEFSSTKMRNSSIEKVVLKIFLILTSLIRRNYFSEETHSFLLRMIQLCVYIKVRLPTLKSNSSIVWGSYIVAGY